MENPEDLDLDDTEVVDRIITKAAKKLVERRDLCFKPKKQTPYTGWYVDFYDDDGVKLLLYFRDGKRDGPYTSWRESGQKSWEGTYKDGKRDGLWVHWFENGQKQFEANYKDGKRVSD